MTTPPPLGKPVEKTAEQIRQEMEESRIQLQATAIRDMQTRIRNVILTARRQVQGKQVMDLDRYLDNCNPTMAVDGRLPWTPARVVTVASRHAIFCNMLGLAILAFGRWANDGEQNDADAQVTELERIVGTIVNGKPMGLLAYKGFPIERSSAIHVLRTLGEQAKLEQDRAARELKAHEQREAMRAAKFEKPEKKDGPNAPQVMEGGVDTVGGESSEPVEPTHGEDPELPQA